MGDPVEGCPFAWLSCSPGFLSYIPGHVRTADIPFDVFDIFLVARRMKRVPSKFFYMIDESRNGLVYSVDLLEIGPLRKASTGLRAKP